MDFFIDFGKKVFLFPVVVSFHGLEFFLFVYFGLYVCSDYLQIFSAHLWELYCQALEIQLDRFAPANIGRVNMTDLGETFGLLD